MASGVNVLCYFSALHSPTKCRLFRSYCASFVAANYGVCKILACRISALLGERGSAVNEFFFLNSSGTRGCHFNNYM